MIIESNSVRVGDYDWERAFEVSTFHGVVLGSPQCVSKRPTTLDVDEVIALVNGQNDEASWVGVFRLYDGRYCALTAWCDYTGWDCQSGGDLWVSANLDALVLFGLDRSDRKQLGFGYVDAALDRAAL